MATRTEDLMAGGLMTGSAINILTINASADEQSQILGQLRDAGFAAHGLTANHETSLISALDKDRPDIALFFTGDEHVPLTRAMALCSNYRPELPFILVYEEENPSLLLTAMTQGVRDLVPRAQLQRLQLVIVREYGDLCTRRQLERLKHRLCESELRSSALIESSHDAIAYIQEGMHTRANRAYLALFGFEHMGELAGIPVMDLVVIEDQNRFKTLLRSLDGRQDTVLVELQCRHRDGHCLALRLEISPIHIEGEPYLQITIREPSQCKAGITSVQLPEKDTQAGICSRDFFIRQLEKRMRQTPATKGEAAVLYIVIDNFRKICDTAGTAATEALLQEMAQLIKSLINEQDFLARSTDHAFTLLPSHFDDAAIDDLAQRICNCVSAHHFAALETPLSVTCSVGTSNAKAGASAHDLIDQAYVASEVARAIMGGNQCASYNDALRSDSPRISIDQPVTSDEIVPLLQNALKNNNLELAFEPVVGLRGDAYENYEAQAQLRDPGGKCIPLAHLPPEVHITRLLADLDRQVIKRAIEQFTAQRQGGRKINVFVPLSAASLKDESIMLWICDCLRAAQAKGSCLTFEITAADLKSHQTSATKLIEGLKKIKCQIAISEFGESELHPPYDSLDIDYVKLSAAWMAGLGTSPAQQIRLQRLCEQLQSRSIKCIATSVEDTEGLVQLWDAGIAHVQGYPVTTDT